MLYLEHISLTLSALARGWCVCSLAAGLVSVQEPLLVLVPLAYCSASLLLCCNVYRPNRVSFGIAIMLSSILAGSVVAWSIGKTYAAGYAWSGVNMGGFDFGCTTDVCAFVMTV